MPRWLQLLKDNFTADIVVYTLATVEDGMPRARTVVHRGFFMHDPARPLLYTNTDVRTPKVQQLHASPASEAVFYFPETHSQMRITARTHVLPAPSHPWRVHFPAPHLSAGGTTPIDWDERRLHAFYAISPVRRASFASLAVPGTPLDGEEEQTPLGTDAGTAEESQRLQRALDHFALVVLEPLAVDYLQLSSPMRRSVWHRTDNGEWEESAVAP